MIATLVKIVIYDTAFSFVFVLTAFFFNLDGNSFVHALEKTWQFFINSQIIFLPLAIFVTWRDYKNEKRSSLQPVQSPQQQLSKAKYKEVADQLKSTVRKTIIITPQLTSRSEPWDSKFGGTPYWPKEMDYPQSGNKQPLSLLAQINLSELPSNSELPANGILQFFINTNIGTYGLDFEKGYFNPDIISTRENGYKVIYHEDITRDKSKLVADFAFVKTDQKNMPFLKGEFKLEFSLQEEIMPIHDFQSKAILGDEVLDILEYELTVFEKDNLFTHNGNHKLIGYPCFVQGDPREYNENTKEYELLFQMTSEYSKSNKEWTIMWGDAGIANFFILPQDLKDKRFDRVLYHWDCG